MIGRKRRGLGQAVSAGSVASLTKPLFPPIPMPVPVVGPQTEAQMIGASSWTPEQAIAATVELQKQQNIQFFSNIPGAPGAAPSGPPDCTSAWTYYTNSDCPADCSRFFTNLFDSSCPGLFAGLPSMSTVLAIAAGVLLLVVVIKR